MQIVTALVAALVFAILVIIDTGALLQLVFAWVVTSTVGRWILLGTAGVLLVWFIRRQRWRHGAVRPRASATARALSKAKAKRPAHARSAARHQRSSATTRRTG
jgi:hypothetical protein